MFQKWTRPLALLMALVLCLGLLPPASAAPTQPQTIRELRQERTITRTDAEEEVCFIVELEEPSMALSLPEGMTLATYLDTGRGAARQKAILAQQNALEQVIERTADAVITHRYQVVLNGFAVTAPYSERATLEALDGVRRVTLGNVYSVPELQEAEGEVITSGELIHSDAVNAEGYTGKGTFAAILDTGLNVAHEAFVGEKVQGAAITADTIAALDDLTAAGDLYKNAKIAFAYDYADGDDDVSDSQGHGTHVAGTVAANGDSFRGVAPDAQLAVMKVFGDIGSAYDSDIFAALEDCVILGVDTVNMSLGTPCGFTYEDDATEAVYNAVRSAGINLMVSAGNETDSAYGNLAGTNLPLASNPDYGILGAPSTYRAALSIASVNEALAYTTYLKLSDTRIAYTEPPDAYDKMGDMNGTYEYAVIPGVGTPSDFAQVDVTGKIALVERGEIAFTEKEENAYDNGAIGLIVYDNSDSAQNIYMQLNGLLPAVFVSREAGQLLKAAEYKSVTLSPDFFGRMESPAAGQMSSFSSMGVSPDMTLKPELTAPGGNVWSTSASGGYEEMSGTSMAAPHMTGSAAVLRQYVNERFPDLSDSEKQALIDNLLLSTAEPVLDENGVPYTPRKQGAGLANISAAVHTGAYLTVDGGLPKAQLGESGDGRYTFTFTIHSIAESTQTYDLSVEPIAAQTETIGDLSCISALCRRMAETELDVTFSQESVTLAPGSSAEITVTIALTAEGKQRLAAFPNGIYVEGFVRLTGDGVTSLGLPYLGFYGDWADAPIFDSTVYDDESSFMAESTLAMIDYNGSGEYLGINTISGAARPEWISYANRNAGYYLITPMLGLLRAPKEIRYSVTPKDDPTNKVYEFAWENSIKSFYYSSGGYIYTEFVPWEDSWQPIGGNDEEGYYYLPDGWYTYTVEARIDGESEFQSLEFPIYIDNSAPEVLSYNYQYVDGTPYLVISIRDDHYVMAAQLVDADCTKALSSIIAIEETEQGVTTTLTFDLSDIQADGYNYCRLDLYDYAWNEYLSDLMSTVSPNTEPQVVQICEYAVTAAMDSSNMEMHATVDPENAVNKSLTWTSTDENVAKVVAVSEDTMTAEIDFVGAGTCEIRATAANGVYGSSSVTVNPSDGGDIGQGVDTTALKEAIDAVGDLNEADYTSQTWAAVEDALEYAEAVLADADTTQAEVDAALAELNAALDALVLRGNKDALRMAVESADALDQRNYTAESWAAVAQARDAAQAVLNDPDALQDQIDAAEQDLEQAMAALVWYVDKSQLEQTVAEARVYQSRLAESVFPAQLLLELEEALIRAEAALEYEFASWSEVQEALAQLNAAWEAVKAYRVYEMYSDVPAGTWFTEPVDFVTRFGFMNGIGGGNFSPGASVTRGQFVVILYRIAGSPAVEVNNPFVDVSSNRFYHDAVLWAYQNKITTGTDATHFSPNDPLPRQALVTFLMRFADSIGIDTSARADLSSFTDAGQINAYAADALSWAVAEGIISGLSPTTLAPRSIAIRAQIATIISRFVPKYLW